MKTQIANISTSASINWLSRIASLTALVLLLCFANGAWAQVQTTDNLLYTLPPSGEPAAPANVGSSSPLPVPPHPVILNFDRLPASPWFVNDCTGHGSGKVSHGILTINSPSDCYEYVLLDPSADWNKYVNNLRGWIVETNLKVDPLTEPTCGGYRGGSVQIWANDRTNLLIVGFSTNEICIVYPEAVHFAMNTTDNFHIYRIEAKERHVRIYVDGQLAIDHFLTVYGAGTLALVFGDGTFIGTSLTRWDYFSYDVFPANGVST